MSFPLRWLSDYARANTGLRTYERYCLIVNRHLIPEFGAAQLSKLRPQHIQAYYSKALQGGRVDGQEGGLSSQVVHHHHRVLRKALHHAARWQLIARNPADAVEPPRPGHKEMHVLNPEGMRKLLTACDDPDVRAIIFTAIATGLREGELLVLRWLDADFDNDSLQVTRSLQYVNRKLNFSEP